MKYFILYILFRKFLWIKPQSPCNYHVQWLYHGHTFSGRVLDKIWLIFNKRIPRLLLDMNTFFKPLRFSQQSFYNTKIIFQIYLLNTFSTTYQYFFLTLIWCISRATMQFIINANFINNFQCEMWNAVAFIHPDQKRHWSNKSNS